MKINISNLSEGIHQYEFNESPSILKLDDRFSKPVLVKVELERRRTQFFLTGHVETSGRFACDRCLEDFDKDLRVDYRMVYVYDLAARPSDKDDEQRDRSEVTVIARGMNEIDIGDDVRQYVLLSVPLKLLCDDNCAGLCSTCGANLNRGSCSCVKEKMDSSDGFTSARVLGSKN